MAGATMLVAVGIWKTWAIITGRDGFETAAGIAILFIGAAIGAGYLMTSVARLNSTWGFHRRPAT